jgi:cysteine desulfuration protein SufE
MPWIAVAMPIDHIRADFDLLDDWEDRYRYVMELGRAMPPLDEALRIDANKVRGCASQVWLAARVAPAADGAGKTLVMTGDSDSHLVRGLVAIIIALYEDLTLAEIASLDAQAELATLGLKEHLTPQRSNGLASMIKRIRADAEAAMAG